VYFCVGVCVKSASRLNKKEKLCGGMGDFEDTVAIMFPMMMAVPLILHGLILLGICWIG
jgi:hypothetical protein